MICTRLLSSRACVTTQKNKLTSFRNLTTQKKNLASFCNLTTQNKNLTSFRNFATRPRKDLKGNVLLYQMTWPWDKPWVFGVLGVGFITLGIAGTVVVQQMIKGIFQTISLMIGRLFISRMIDRLKFYSSSRLYR